MCSSVIGYFLRFFRKVETLLSHSFDVGTDRVHVDRFRSRHLQSAAKRSSRLRQVQSLQCWLEPSTPATFYATGIGNDHDRSRFFLLSHYSQKLRNGKHFPSGYTRPLRDVGLATAQCLPFQPQATVVTQTALKLNVNWTEIVNCPHPSNGGAGLFRSLGFRTNVDLPTCQSGCQTGILPLFADSQAELIVGNNGTSHLQVRISDIDPHHLGW